MLTSHPMRALERPHARTKRERRHNVTVPVRDPRIAALRELPVTRACAPDANEMAVCALFTFVYPNPETRIHHANQ